MQPGIPTVSELHLFFAFDVNLRYSHIDLLVNSGGVVAVAGSVAGVEKTKEFSGSKTDFSFGSIVVAFWKHCKVGSIVHTIKECWILIVVADGWFGSRFALPLGREVELIYARDVF